MILVIMAAGMGSRFGGLKQLEPVGPGGEFIVDYSIYDAVAAGIDKVVFIIKEENLELFRNTVGKRIERNVKVEYAFQSLEAVPEGTVIPPTRTKPLGTAHAVLCARDFVDESFMVINADDFYGREAFFLLKNHLSTVESGKRSHYAMAGYTLKNTLTENGSVARGCCQTDMAGYLTQITERTKLQRIDGSTRYLDDDGIWKAIDENSIVSMNCWGFMPDFFDKLEKQLKGFVVQNQDRMETAEFYLPSAVESAMSAGECDVKVLNTSAKWYGMTYREDKEALLKAIREMVDKGIYPDVLWK